MSSCAACELRFAACVDVDAYVRACAPMAPRNGDDGASGGACAVCLGILQIASDADARALEDGEREAARRVLEIDDVGAFARRAVSRGHGGMAGYRFRVVLPAATLTRERAMRATRGIDDATRVTGIDEVLRMLARKSLGEALGCDEDSTAAYALTAKYKYGDDAKETEFLSSVSLKLSKEERKGKFRGKHLKWHKGGKRKRGTTEADFLSHLSSPEDPFAEEFETAERAYEDAAKRLADAKFADASFWLSNSDVTLAAPRFRARCIVEAFHEPVHVGGWYVKLDRGVPQSPWVMRETGKRVGRGSVVEAIESVVLDKFASRGAKFNSSGREDMDVRMLSEGRPFASQVHDPKRPTVSADEIAEMERTINAKCDQTGVRVRGLCLTTKEHYHAVGQHSEESEKEKSYVAICRISRRVTAEDHKTIAAVSNLVVQQSTPTRVVHRRTDMVRPRTIVHMSSEPIPGAPDALILRLRTQAGTYIKEFVHGDGGRTKPSLGDLLGCKAQILQLDVTEVDDAWNPSGAAPNAESVQ